MSFHYQYAPPKRYRGKLSKQYQWRYLEEKARLLIISLAIVAAVGIVFYNSKSGYNLRYMINTGTYDWRLILRLK